MTYVLAAEVEKEKTAQTARQLSLFGGPCRARTCDTLIKSQVLYQLS
jgi:hypothetical protein